MSARRGVGLSAFQNRTSLSNIYASHGASLRSTQATSLQTQLSVFQSLLHNFALQHADTIKSNPSFRAEFARMCNAIGVDPLAGSNVKGKSPSGRGIGSLWAKILGGDVNDFYFELAVRVVEVCRGSRGENGGLLGVKECKEIVKKGRGIGGGMDVSEYVGFFNTVCMGIYRILLSSNLQTKVMISCVPSNPSNPSDLASRSSPLAVNK